MYVYLKPAKRAMNVRIDNSFLLETQAQEWDLNPDPESPQAAGPGDQGGYLPVFTGVKPLQAEANNDDPNGEAIQTKGIIVPNGGLIKVPNGGNETSTISFMGLKSTLVANQESSPEGGAVPQPKSMTTT
ncbi:hypothetical protein DSO57_1003942 [Entomophthora muscae]|uniref:Uncharacterized protein n=1 Tax=Entomophthora muscae TaxID=34485 RepID=A0ACC2RZE6_9FUNG|nr:hypothetical protein DSO57_1003942 [Entomophthora muscae]